MTEEYLLQRYDGVVHLVTAAEGAEAFYQSGRIVSESGQVTLRHETPEQARALDLRMQEVWKEHPQQVIVRNGPGGFAGKLEIAAEAILDVARRTHPQDRLER